LKILSSAFLFFALFPQISAAGNGHAYFPGEELVYRVTALKFLSAGTAEFKVEEFKGAEGEEFYKLRADVYSTFPFSIIYRIKDSMESCVDAETLMPVSFEKIRKEASFRRHVSVEFDREKNIVVSKKESSSFPIPNGVQDYLTAFYHMRALDIKPGESAVFSATGGRKTYDVKLEALRKENLFKWGKEIETIVVRPSVSKFESGGILDEDSPEMIVWITDDNMRIPLKIDVKVSIGWVSLVLVRYTKGDNV
jgi:hypothetical protein